jgi:hypothetical protein
MGVVMNFKNSPDSDRDQLGFASEVVSAFKFLSTEYGFQCVRIEQTFVRYESISSFVNIYHGRRSFELGVEIGRLEKVPGLQENWYTIGEILDLIGVREKLGFTFFQASTHERVQMLVPKLAEYVREYARPIFEGDSKIFESLSNLRRKKSEDLIREMRLSQIRDKATTAWHKKDYAKLIELYNSMKDDLTQVEIKKLEYAKKHLHIA